MAEKLSFEAPRGMRDFYPEDMVWRNKVFDAFRAAGEAAGFEPYDACVVESYELLARKAGEEVGEQIYHFNDKSERHLALRAEMTPTLARMVAQRQKELPFPLKWTTIAQCFRYERMTKGRKREHYQWNCDIVGEESVLAEVEVLGAACDALRRMGLSNADFRVHVSNRALLSELLAASGIPADLHAQVFLALDKRGKMPDEEIAAMLRDGGVDEAGVKATFAIMDLKTLDEAEKLGMTCDLIVGSGWPFGAETLPREERAEVLLTLAQPVESGKLFEMSKFHIFKELDPGVSVTNTRRIPHLVQALLVPDPISSLDQAIDVTDKFVDDVISPCRGQVAVLCNGALRVLRLRDQRCSGCGRLHT